ncbi:uncharacterized protein N7479_009162 [Penicillium vulpinum]|uniref:uncharacterized protein n=1 Tax=Penicillium vulpinum TaxID=29845 RepID=UPI0025471B80|nr:uncharacterized protein N7479_009162 [Penicillium vulpinum]KAJ5950749.1 hypothetical protein N7479_009162 [Penicillium vulpinum]
MDDYGGRLERDSYVNLARVGILENRKLRRPYFDEEQQILVALSATCRRLDLTSCRVTIYRRAKTGAPVHDQQCHTSIWASLQVSSDC